MPRYNNDGRSAKFLLDTRQGFQNDRMRGIRKKDMKIKLDTDVSMGDEDGPSNQSHHSRHGGGKKFQGNKHHGGGGGGGGRGGGRRKGGKWTKPRHPGADGQEKGFRHEFGPAWHKCTIMGGSSMNRDNILQVILQALRNKDILFQPICYTVNPPNSIFYIENRSVAEAIASLSFESIKFRITHVSPPPTVPFTPELEERLSFELKSRLSQTGLLNLSNFHNTVSMAVEHYLPLSRISVGNVIGKLVKDWIAHVTSVDVSFNKLPSTESIAFLNQGTNIKCLIANDNKLRDLNALDHLKSSTLLELNIRNNPATDRFTDRSKYELEIRKKFSGLLKLDNQEIDPTKCINFDVEKYSVPTLKKSWFCNESAQNVVKTFVAEYVRLYDSSREDLANAYSEQAVMTLSSSYVKDGTSISSSIGSHHSSNNQRLSEYIGESRNILNNSRSNKSRKGRHVHVGRQEIIKLLAKLPASKHLDYVIDMPVALEAFIMFTMQGLFREPRDKNMTRHFTRSFILVPFNTGFVIVNEMFFVTNPTSPQLKSITTVQSDQRPQSSRLETPTKPEIKPLFDSYKPPQTVEEKLKLFCEKSLMNMEWARKCLDENGWDLERSMYVFSELNNAGKIPPEAFQPSRIS
ncbi:unnamed protein product [Allacma fusca]|uniref:Nuclear RNA export factor 1 n=1 Tax=Allacma fusca TaxID=39272 RepID=A0A8J2LFL9_9HEXA|nr:unnamed protein product [Allacma fusca]